MAGLRSGMPSAASQYAGNSALTCRPEVAVRETHMLIYCMLATCLGRRVVERLTRGARHRR